MRIRWMWAVVAFTLALWGIEAVGKTAADIQRDIPEGVLSDQVRAIMQRITQWREACTAGDLEAIEKVYPPGKGRGAKSDLIAVNSILEATPDWQPSFLALMWDDSKAQVISHKVKMRGADCPRAITWKFEKLDGTWYLSDQSEGWSLGTFRNQEDLFAMLDMSAFMEDYPIGHMWSDKPDPKLRFKTNSRKDEAAAFKESLWPQLDGAPEEVREIAELVKEWLAAWMAEDIERARAMCTPDALRLFERDRRSNHRTLTGTKGQWFSPMAVKTRPLEAEVISHPMQIELHGFRARMVIQVNLRKVDDRWKIERHSGRQVRGLADSFADFLNRHSDGMIWLDDAAPEWLKLEQQTQTDITIKQITRRLEQCEQNNSYEDAFKESVYDKEMFYAYFPDSQEGGERLDRWWEIRDKPDSWKNENGWLLSDDEILKIICNGLRRSSIQNRHILLLEHVGSKYISGRKPPNAAAVDLLHHASLHPTYAPKAVKDGLCAANPKSEQVLEHLFELCLANEYTAEIVLGIRASKQENQFLAVVEPYLNAPDPEKRKRAAIVHKVFVEKVNRGQLVGQLHYRQMRAFAQAIYGQMLPQIREFMLKGSSRQRSQLFDLLDRKKIHPAFDESFIGPLTACLQDGNPEVREEALKLGMYPLLADGQRRGQILELMDQLSRDYDDKVRLAVASFMSEYWIPSQEVQEPLAIDIEMRLSKDMFFHEIRNEAVCGLALVKNKSDEVIMRLVDMVPDWNVDLGRIRRGLEVGADKEKIRTYLQPYLCLKGERGDRVKNLYQKIFNEEPSID
ncbi:MAG TPA: hypothetical protein VJJ98_06705 [Sedimentisphaerales bacterium]|nr:hypothetical protein [Sedimentisphaerales bacterium]